MLESRAKPFLAAYYILKTMEDEGCTDCSIWLNLDGSCVLAMTAKEYQHHKYLAEALVESKKWFMDNYGNYCLASKHGLTEIEGETSDK
jgi:hypothetical protein